MTDKQKKLYLTIMVIVPFLLYSIYYYYQLIRKAPYQFAEFQSIQIHYQKPGLLGYRYDSSTGLYQYVEANGDTISKCLLFSVDTLQQFHRKLVEALFFDMPRQMQGKIPALSGAETPPSYFLKANYARKSWQICWNKYYDGKQIYSERLARLKKYFEVRLTDASR